MKGICVLGSTGSIGVSTLDVVGRHPGSYRVVALTANHNVQRLLEQCLRFEPDYAVMIDERPAAELRERLARAGQNSTQVLSGKKALEDVAVLPEVDSVMAAIVGAAGLPPTLAAAKAGKTVLLANKEALVMSGPLFMAEVVKSGADLLPIDSEHNAIFQCMPAHYHAGRPAPEVRRILLTASGGPFLRKPLEELYAVTPEQAVAHPNWVMGRKISVDSATMMNKGLEVIEACLLFGMPPEKVQVVVHRQSVIHSMVDYVDGTVLAQMGNPDMRIPIAHALAWPGRFDSGAEPLDLFGVRQLDFEPPDFERFPCLRLAYEAVRGGGTEPAILNAANEIAVAAFLEGRLRFPAIPDTIAHCMDAIPAGAADSIEAVLEADRTARAVAHDYIARL
ncbi:1-deoxy-D-xylulose 5-phosphate reductoisomerase [Methylomagnum ishizawai]|uniref:1-deoxy-D-xylulose 5-phosphate reductoisomerase n=1 Tax=Methylomagnum ishizawai TaxID=1760988 RepID=A0A1Y6D2L8_9GAMM|nr:1-deoxy-D-xylulose-5-phosphate reductoisomerase [Methylomagnum ishizawai]SMF96897.1 1-deoxy-D-xylulose 5-phosphate reductoisomerase [Methylomagnum ishizawai]